MGLVYGNAMKTCYFKRLKMEVDLIDAPPVPPLPPGYSFVPWSDSLLATHAEVKFACFVGELDATVFPNLGSREGCLHLMTEIRKKSGFLPEATWLLAGPAGYCGTVQGICDRHRLGAIQNLGITPEHRGLGLGRALLLKALEGFSRHGLGRGFLEVTAQNEAAVRLYRQVGFRARKTVYKAVETPEPWPVAGVR
jgi:ribosomal protein S18 acetylase RimI-like enzyme